MEKKEFNKKFMEKLENLSLMLLEKDLEEMEDCEAKN